MRIYYTNKLIFWSNEGNDFIEKNQFDTYLNDWTEINNSKSINWEDHYSANFYATDNFEATYFKVVKNNKNYYFFIQDIQFDSANGRQYFLQLDFYNTYVIGFIEILKRENPQVVFKRKHANRYNITGSLKYIDIENQHNYLNNVPDYLSAYSQYVIPVDKVDYTPINRTRDVGRITVPQSAGGEISVNDNNYTEYYLQLKRPNKAISNTLGTAFANEKQIFYVPVSTNSLDGPNSYKLLAQIPADYVVGLIRSHIRPTQFSHVDYANALYKFSSGESGYQNPFFDSQSLIFIDNGSIKDNSINVEFFKDIQQAYNIDNYDNEPMLYLSPFTYFSICNNERFYANYYLIKTQNLNSFTTITLNTIIDTQILVYPPIANSLYNNQYWSDILFENGSKIPFSGNVYENYLLSNINSMNTGIALAKEQRDMTINQSNIKGGLDIATGLLSGIAGVASGNWKMAAGGLTSVVGGSTDIAFNKEKAEFNYKSTVAKLDAQKADVANKPNTMLDTYGDGQARSLLSVLTISKYELPIPYKKMVFSDFYFNGYVVNTVDSFNSYNNRTYFNYFELANVYNLATQYLKYPKAILKDLARFVQQGIRIWKTPNFDYTMKLDNREIAYA